MSHKLVSNTAVVYNAQTQASSVLTITPQQTSFNDNEGNQGGGSTHTVTVNGIVWANYGLLGQTQIDRVGFTIDSTTWDAFYASASEAFLTTSSYDNVVETALEYIQANLTPIYGLSTASWSVEM